jgi:hypothetical protein
MYPLRDAAGATGLVAPEREMTWRFVADGDYVAVPVGHRHEARLVGVEVYTRAHPGWLRPDLAGVSELYPEDVDGRVDRQRRAGSPRSADPGPPGRRLAGGRSGAGDVVGWVLGRSDCRCSCTRRACTIWSRRTCNCRWRAGTWPRWARCGCSGTRVEGLLAEHARAAHEAADGRPWRDVTDAVGVHVSSMSGWDRAVRQGRPVGRPHREHWAGHERSRHPSLRAPPHGRRSPQVTRRGLTESRSVTCSATRTRSPAARA